MSNIIKVTSRSGKVIEFIDTIIGSGAMKDVYFTKCKTKVVAFYRDEQNKSSCERIEKITHDYYDGIFNGNDGDYWKKYFCWPYDIVEYNGKLGIVLDVYASNFFFEYGSFNNDFLNIKGKEKEGKWFASTRNQFRYLAPEERGNWLNYIQICLKIARAIRRMHAAGLAHSDLSYKNILVSPISGDVCIIDVDGLVVPNKYPPDVVGTPDFIAPEVLATQHLDKNSPQRFLPSIHTDRHALAVLIYQYLLLRHPLRGSKIHSDDPTEDESLLMGERALFIENSIDKSNRLDASDAKPFDLPWKDTSKLPYTITGPYLSDLFKRAFVDGLHAPNKRPSADEWETALMKTVDLIQPCKNKACSQKWYVFPNSKRPKCPFCGQGYNGQLPVINLYYSSDGKTFREENHRLMVYKDQSLFKWHIDRSITPNEKLTIGNAERIGYFTLHNNNWLLVNQKIDNLIVIDGSEETIIKRNEFLVLKEGLKICFGKERNKRLFVVQIVSN